MESFKYLLTKGFDPVVDVAVILGSGLGGFTGNVSNAISVNYSDIPGFPEVTVAGHGGEVTLPEKLYSSSPDAFITTKDIHSTEPYFPLKSLLRSKLVTLLCRMQPAG